MKYTICFLLLAFTISCQNSKSDKDQDSKSDKEIKKNFNNLTRNYWVTTETKLKDYSNENSSKQEKISESDKTIHHFSDLGLVKIYNLDGELQNTFNYDTVIEDDRITKIIVENSFTNEKNEYFTMVSKNYLELTEIIANAQTTSKKRHEFKPLRDSTLLREIKN